MIGKLGKKGLAMLAGAALIVVVSAIAAAVGLTWLAVAGLGLLQVAVLGLLLVLRWTIGKPYAALKGVDALSERMMAAVESERLDALDRHAELMAAVKPGSEATRS